MTKHEYFNKPSKMAYHNLCTLEKPPPAIGKLLGLGLKFCIQNKKPSDELLQQGIQRFKRSIRLKHFFSENPTNPLHDTSSKDNKKIYIKSTWQPKHKDLKLENTLVQFEQKLIKERIRVIRHSYDRTNLTKQQQNMIKTLKKNKHLMIIPTDKNLGPAIIERDIYIKHILREHLNNPTYTQLTTEEYNTQMLLFMRTASQYFELHKNKLPTEEKSYLAHCLYNTQQLSEYTNAKFYGTPKVHKKQKPYIRFRPIVSQFLTFGAKLSIYLDYKLQPLITTVESYVKDSFQVITQLKSHGKFPPGSKILTADAVSMYTNIDPSEGIPTIKNYIHKFSTDIHPSEFIIDLLNLVMENNLFQFGNTWWRQKIGTAMGTPCACIYATLFFAYYEQTYLLRKYKQNLLFYKRMIDDILIIWKPTTKETWENFKLDLNKQCKLNWDIEEPSTTTDFLDLTLSIDNDGLVTTKTFQKDMNLFLYIPPNSAHPPGMIKSLIYGLLRTYKLQNTYHKDFLKYSSLLYHRLIARGHNQTNLNEHFRDAAIKLSTQSSSPTTTPPYIIQHPCHKKRKLTTNNDDNIFFHIPYHPRDISRQQFHSIYNSTLHNTSPTTCNIRTYHNMNIKKLTIAYSRGPNLFDILCSSTLHEYTATASEILTQLQTQAHG